MSVAREAKLIMRLIDRVSGPARAITGSLTTLGTVSKTLGGASMAGARAFAHLGRSARRASYDTALLSAPILAGASAAARSVYDYEKMGNAAEAVGRLTEEQRERLEALGKQLNARYPFLNKDILDASFELGRAGMTFKQIMGGLEDTLNTSLAGDIALGKTADIMTNVAQAMRLPMESTEQTSKTMQRISDVLAYAATRSNTSIEEMAVAFRYVAPLAAATGMSLEQMATATMMLANNGIKGSNAGTGLRFALIRMIKPTKDAMAAFERLNINIKDYVKGAQTITGEQLANALSLEGIDASGLIPEMDDLLKNPKFSKAPAKMVAQLTDLISAELGDEGVLPRNVLADALSKNLTVLGTQVDLQGFLNAVRDNPDAEALFPVIFGARHAAKIMAVMAGDFDGTLSKMEESYKGAADRMSRIRMKGVVGDWAHLRAVIDNFIMMLSDSGVLNSAMTAIREFTGAVGAVASLNPALLEFGTYALLALGALAPLGFAVAGVAAAVGFLINPLTWAVGGFAALTGYLAVKNWKSITSAVEGFSTSFQRNMGPKTQQLVDRLGQKVREFYGWVTGDREAGSEWRWRKSGASWGKWLAERVEYEISEVQALYSEFEAAGRNVASWFKKGWETLGSIDWDRYLDLDYAYEKITQFFKFLGDVLNSLVGAPDMSDTDNILAQAAFFAAAERRSREGPLAARPDARKTADEAGAAIDKHTKDWPQAAKDALDRYTIEIIRSGDKTSAEARALAERVKAELGITVKPIIDQSSLDATMDKAARIGQMLKSLGVSVGTGPTPAPAIAGERAHGGPVLARRTYLVGEKGPELFTPSGAGRIHPNSSLPGGPVTIQNTFHVSSADPLQAAREIGRVLERQLSRSQQRALDGRPSYD
ncbi:MAG: phage tail tape measure protein [Roseibium sp.]|nr:phage tail tape measure protein [Roseibium sp.]